MVPLRIRYEGQERDLLPGSPINLPAYKARRLMQKAGGRIRSWHARDMLGARIRWHNQYLKPCEGQVAFYALEGWYVVTCEPDHDPVLIHLNGNVRVISCL
jgi:hypothetical protein